MEIVEPEVVSSEVAQVMPNTIDTLERASIDMQIATAHKFPRSIAKFKENALALVTLDEETAASCIYRRPVGKKLNEQSGKWEESYAEGMSIRMAEIVASCYGNMRVGTRIIEQTERQVVVQGVAHDLESNFLSTAEVIEATVTSDKNGKPKPYSERMRVVIVKAASAKARRDAIFQVVPRAVAKSLEVAVKELLFGNASSITKWRTRIAGWVKTLGIDEKRVWNALNVQGPEDLKQSEIETLVGIQNALKSGDTDLDTAFPALEDGERFRQPAKKAAGETAKPVDEKTETRKPSDGKLI